MQVNNEPVAVIFYDPNMKKQAKVVALIDSRESFNQVEYMFKRKAAEQELLVMLLGSYFNGFESDNWKPSVSTWVTEIELDDPFYIALNDLKGWVDGVSELKPHMFGYASHYLHVKSDRQKLLAVFMDPELQASIVFSQSWKTDPEYVVLNENDFSLSSIAGQWNAHHPNFHP